MIVTLNRLRKFLKMPIKMAGKYPIHSNFLIKNKAGKSRRHIFFTIFDKNSIKLILYNPKIKPYELSGIFVNKPCSFHVYYPAEFSTAFVFLYRFFCI